MAPRIARNSVCVCVCDKTDNNYSHHRSSRSRERFHRLLFASVVGYVFVYLVSLARIQSRAEHTILIDKRTQINARTPMCVLNVYL